MDSRSHFQRGQIAHRVPPNPRLELMGPRLRGATPQPKRSPLPSWRIKGKSGCSRQPSAAVQPPLNSPSKILDAPHPPPLSPRGGPALRGLFDP